MALPTEVIDVDHEGLLFVAEEHGAAVGGGHGALDGHGDGILGHGGNVGGEPVEASGRLRQSHRG
jgi:hypothetical protein